MLLFMYAFVKKRRDLLSFTYSTVCKPDITQKIKLQMLESKLIFSRDVTFFKHAIIVLAEKSFFCSTKTSLSCFNTFKIASCSPFTGHIIRIINFNIVSILLESIAEKIISNNSLLTFCVSLYTIPKSMMPTFITFITVFFY